MKSKILTPVEKYYFQKFAGKTFVVKFGGEVLEYPDRLKNLLRDVKFLTEGGIKIVLIHGGGKQVDNLTKTLGGEIQKIEGRRVTTKADLDTVAMLFGGSLNLRILGAMRQVGLIGQRVSALDGDFILARKRHTRKHDYGFVGDITRVNPLPINQTLADGYIPVIPSLSADAQGNLLNTNADTVATEVAKALKAEKLIFFTDVNGILVDGKIVSTLSTTKAKQYINAGKITGGMIVKIHNAEAALRAGVKRCQILNGTKKQALSKEVLADKGTGTMIVLPEEEKRYFAEIKGEGKRLTTEALLEKLVSIESISGNEITIARFLKNYLSGSGIKTKLDNHNVWAEKGYGKKVFLLQAHIDTVPAGKGWKGNPFKLRNQAGKLIGRGAADNKAQVAAFTHAFMDITPPADSKIILALTREEEVGNRGLQKLISKLPTPTTAIIGEPTDEKIRTAQKGRVVIECEVTAAGGHSAYTSRENNAFFKALELVKKLESITCKPDPILGEMTFQVSFCEAGETNLFNVVPTTAVFQAEWRTIPSLSNQALIKKIAALCGDSYKVLKDKVEAKSTSSKTEIVQAAQKALQTEELHPAPGISDFHCLSCPGIVFGAKGGNLHAAEEWVDLASMLRVE
ncbi:MAG: acetylglutamate kinase, partial [Candidatus Gracilibacteria bacterium]